MKMPRELENPYADAKEFRLPNASHRTVVLGRTGSGKTMFMRWLLSRAPIETMPWIVFDYKKSDDFSDIPYTHKIKIGDLPTKPGIYILKPSVKDDERINAYLFDILERGNIGLLFDEGASVPQKEPRFVGLKAVLSQGRGKRVPVIFGSQRPKWINKSLLSEGDFFARFHLSFDDDAAAVNAFMPKAAQNPLDDYFCHWYDLAKHRLFILQPVSDDDTLQTFEERLRPTRRLL